jgi:hypothetical protein
VAQVTLAANLPRGVAATIEIPLQRHALGAVDSDGEASAIAAIDLAATAPAPGS